MPNGNIFDRVVGWLRAGYPQGVPQGDYIALFGILHRSLTTDEIELIAGRLGENHPSDQPHSSEDEIRAMIRDLVRQEASDEDVRRVASRLAQGGWPLVGFSHTSVAGNPEVPDPPEVASPESAPAEPTAAADPSSSAAASAAPPSALAEPTAAPEASASAASSTPTEPTAADEGWVAAAASPEPSASVVPDGRRTRFSRIDRILSWLRQGYPHGIPEADFVPLLAVLRRKLSEEEISELAGDLRDAGVIPADRYAIAAEYLRITDELASESELARVTQRLRDAGVEINDPDLRTPPGASGSGV